MALSAFIICCLKRDKGFFQQIAYNIHYSIYITHTSISSHQCWINAHRRTKNNILTIICSKYISLLFITGLLSFTLSIVIFKWRKHLEISSQYFKSSKFIFIFGLTAFMLGISLKKFDAYELSYFHA